jgi:antitoxin ParD1/3/4
MRTHKAISTSRGALDRPLREKVKASMADGRPSVPAGDVFKRLRAHHKGRLKAPKRNA